MYSYSESDKWEHNPGMRPATEAQKRFLKAMNVYVFPFTTVEQASRLIEENLPRWEKQPATRDQEFILRRKQLWRDGMTRGEAKELIDELPNYHPVIKSSWVKPRSDAAKPRSRRRNRT